MFVRTKDGVHEFVQGMEIANWEINGLKIKQLIFDNGKTFINFLGEVVSQSYKLEELCDEFVFVNKIGKFDKTHVIHYYMHKRFFTELTTEEKITYIKDVYKDELDKIRGAIYTDKGLIYVAKMNDKGELELI